MKNMHYTIKNFNIVDKLLQILNTNDENSPQYVVAKYALEHFDELESMSIYELAEACYISRSSIQRIIKDLGFDSFTSIKQKVTDVKFHNLFEQQYFNNPNYLFTIKESLDNMIVDINNCMVEYNYQEIADLIHSCKTVVFLTANSTSFSVKQFQKKLLGINKLVRIVTNNTLKTSVIDNLTEDDLLITSSISGNYALATIKSIAQLKAKKLLITINHSHTLKEHFDKVYYLTSRDFCYDEIKGLQNVYTKFAGLYFFELLFYLYANNYFNI